MTDTIDGAELNRLDAQFWLYQQVRAAVASATNDEASIDDATGRIMALFDARLAEAERGQTLAEQDVRVAR